VSIFDVPASAIDGPLVDSFLAEQFAEGLNIDYKRQLGPTVFETVSAMANTYGGVIFVGVDEDKSEDPPKPVLPPHGIQRGDRERFVNQSFACLTPPFAPDVVQVTTGTGQDVLVVRVYPERADRPVFVSRKDDHGVWIRLEARNAPADRYRLDSLFREGSPGSAGLVIANWNLENAGRRPADDWGGFGPTLGARVAVEAPLPYGRRQTAMIDTEVRAALESALRRSALTTWFDSYVARVDEKVEGDWMPFAEMYGNHSSAGVQRWRGRFLFGGPEVAVPVAGQVMLQLPPYGPAVSDGKVSLVVDAAFNPQTFDSALASLPRRFQFQCRRLERLSLEDLYRLFLALLSSAVDTLAPALFPLVLGVPQWLTLGPAAYLECHVDQFGNQGGLGHFLEVEQYVDRRVPANLELRRSHTMQFPPGMSFDSVADRQETVKLWLARLLLDMALAGFDDDLKQM
jgi:hypothetical protein